MIKKLFKSATIKNAGWLIIGRIGQMVISLVVGLLTARFLGPANYGLINYAAAYAAFFMSFCTLGINSVLVKELIDRPQEEGVILGSTLTMRAISSFLSAGAILCLVCVVDAGETITILVTALYCLSLPFHIFEAFNYWFQSKLQSKVTSIVFLIAYTCIAIYKIVLLVLGKSVAWFAFANTLDYICVGVMMLFCYKKYGGKKLGFSMDVSKRILSKSVHFILPSLMISIYGYTDKFMLKHMLTEAEVGYYSTATALCGMWCFVLTAIIDSVTPSIMEARKQDLVTYEKKNRQLYAIVFYVSMGVSVLFCVFGNLAVGLLYGEAYLPSVSPLRVITWYTAFSYLGVARNAWIVCENKQKYLKYIYISAAASNVIINLLCIPVWGAVGAAAASLTTQILTTMVIPFLIKPLRRNSVLMLEGILLKGIR